MPKSVTIHATPGTRKQWSGNQCVSISSKMTDCLLVTSGQNRSTPGLYTRMYLKQNTNYSVEMKGCSLHNARAFVWIYDPRTKDRLVPNYTFLPKQKRGIVHAHFCSPSSANEYVCLHVGVLFTGPTHGQQFEICRITVACAVPSSDKTHHHKHVSHGHDHQHDPNCHDHTTHGHASTHEHVNDCHTDSNSTSDSELEIHHHHHKQGSSHNTHDPYYTYDVQHSAPPHHHGPSTDAYHHPTSASYEAPPHHASYPSQTYQQTGYQSENYRIDDLQESLDTMIKRMKTA